MNATQLGDAFLQHWDEMWFRAVQPHKSADEQAQEERRRRIREGKTRQVAWLMKQEGMSR